MTNSSYVLTVLLAAVGMMGSACSQEPPVEQVPALRAARPAAETEQQAARHRIITSTLYAKDGGVDAALAELRQQQKKYPKANFSESLLDIARYCVESRPDGAVKLADEILRDYSDQVAAAMACIVQGQVYERAGKEAQMLNAYERALAIKVANPNQRLMNDLGIAWPRQEANECLGRYYMRKGNYVKALEYLSSVVPGGWCGTGNRAVAHVRDRDILACLGHVNDPAVRRAALEKVVLDHTDAGWPAMRALIDEYSRAGQLAVLEEKARKSINRTMVSYFAIRAAEAKKDYVTIWRELGGQGVWDRAISQDDEWYFPTRDLCLDALARAGKDAAGFLEGKLKSTSSWDQHMALLALAYIQPADAFKRARELLSTHTNWTDKLDLYYIIGQAGTPEALSFLRKQAADGDDNDKRAADGTLAELKKAKATTRPVLPPASQPA